MEANFINRATASLSMTNSLNWPITHNQAVTRRKALKQFGTGIAGIGARQQWRRHLLPSSITRSLTHLSKRVSNTNTHTRNRNIKIYANHQPEFSIRAAFRLGTANKQRHGDFPITGNAGHSDPNGLHRRIFRRQRSPLGQAPDRGQRRKYQRGQRRRECLIWAPRLVGQLR